MLHGVGRDDGLDHLVFLDGVHDLLDLDIFDAPEDVSPAYVYEFPHEPLMEIGARAVGVGQHVRVVLFDDGFLLLVRLDDAEGHGQLHGEQEVSCFV